MNRWKSDEQPRVPEGYRAEGLQGSLAAQREREDMDRVSEAVRAAAAVCGHPVVYVTRVPVDAPAPDAASRARLDQLMPELVKACSTYHVVLEGDGFGAAMKRGILTGLVQLSWRRKTFFVHASTSQVAQDVHPAERRALTELLDAAREYQDRAATSSARPPVRSAE